MSKKKFIILTCLVVAVTVAFLAIRFANTKLPGNTVTEYNAYATQKAWADGSIRENEILILESMTRSNGNTTVKFRIYAMPLGAVAANYMRLQVSEIPADSPLEQMGSASCVFFGDQLNSVSSISTLYLR